VPAQRLLRLLLLLLHQGMPVPASSCLHIALIHRLKTPVCLHAGTLVT
jgi:hypothetical protein